MTLLQYDVRDTATGFVHRQFADEAGVPVAGLHAGAPVQGLHSLREEFLFHLLGVGSAQHGRRRYVPFWF